MKFAHIADTHIRNLKFHYEYKAVFEQLYERLKQENVDYIIHCGDIAHTKTQISPEFVEMCSGFFRNLESIAPTYVILGNHDGNLKNSSRQDALSPIVQALALPNLYLLKDSGETILDDRFCLNVLSVFDEDNWTQPTDKDKINIALYHGSISGVKTDIGWTMENGEHDVNIFNNFDFAFLGDIHKTNQALDLKGRIRYCGSTIQQNHGETNDKGMLLWDIRDKWDWDCKHVAFKNPKPFHTIVLTPTGKMPRRLAVPKNARLRLVSENNLPLDAMRRALDIAKHRFKPESISFLNRAAGQRGDVEDLTSGLELENLRDVSIQEELMDEYLKDYQADSDTMDTIYNLNRRYNKIVEDNEEISRNVKWKINSFKWDNLFNYGEDNSINFANLSGIIGIFGKNFSGKSSIIDAALYTMFNTTTKNERKNLNLINQNKAFGRGELEIQIGTNRYTITRASEKYTKKLKGDETIEAKTDLNFEVLDEVTGEVTSLNGTTRNKTDANIRKHFGAFEDFSMSSLSSQHGAFTFIDEGSTKRKEIIAKFLDLEFFDQKFKLAKEDSQETKVLLKKSADREFDTEIEKVEEELQKAKEQTDNNIKTCSTLKQEIGVLEDEMKVLEARIASVPTQYIDITDVVSESENKKYQIRKMDEVLATANEELKTKIEKLEKANGLISSYDIDDLRKKKEEIDKLTNAIDKLNNQITNINKKRDLLAGIPCGDEFPTCRFIKDAHDAVLGSEAVEITLAETTKDLSQMDSETINRRIEQYTKIKDFKQGLETDVGSLQLRIEKATNTKANLANELAVIEERIKEYNDNKELIENLEKMIAQKVDCQDRINKAEKKIDNCEKKTLDLYKTIGSKEQMLETLTQEKADYLRLQTEYAAYDLFMRCMHPNGIAYDVIKKKIPVINQEMAKILANIVEFEIFFESNGNKLDIFIKHARHDPRPIEMSSGAEKTMAAMAIRLALLSVSSLPVSDTFILDEPGTALDEENMEGFIRILELIKVYFKNVLLISHLDSLKDCVDMQIVIDKDKGFARVNQ